MALRKAWTWRNGALKIGSVLSLGGPYAIGRLRLAARAVPEVCG
jgi:hypothetical protein